jgi:hypothetical protein
MGRKGASLLLFVLLLHGIMVLAADIALVADPADPFSGEDEIYPFSLRYRQQVDEQIAQTHLQTPAGLSGPAPIGEWPPGFDRVPLNRPAGTDLLYMLMSLRW